MTVAAGLLKFRVQFQRREIAGKDRHGNPTPGTWTTYMTRWASFRPEQGAERLEAGRLESTLRGLVTIRRAPDLYIDVAAVVTPAHRMVFLTPPYAGRSAQMRSVMPTRDGTSLEITVEIGVAE